MIQLVPFVLGVAAGSIAVKALKSGKMNKKLSDTKKNIRKVAVDGLSTLESSASKLKDKLQQCSEDDAKGEKNE